MHGVVSSMSRLGTEGSEMLAAVMHLDSHIKSALYPDEPEDGQDRQDSEDGDMVVSGGDE